MGYFRFFQIHKRRKSTPTTLSKTNAPSSQNSSDNTHSSSHIPPHHQDSPQQNTFGNTHSLNDNRLDSVKCKTDAPKTSRMLTIPPRRDALYRKCGTAIVITRDPNHIARETSKSSHPHIHPTNQIIFAGSLHSQVRSISAK